MALIKVLKKYLKNMFLIKLNTLIFHIITYRFQILIEFEFHEIAGNSVAYCIFKNQLPVNNVSFRVNNLSTMCLLHA